MQCEQKLSDGTQCPEQAVVIWLSWSGDIPVCETHAKKAVEVCEALGVVHSTNPVPDAA
jgi:hypothetical protein